MSCQITNTQMNRQTDGRTDNTHSPHFFLVLGFFPPVFFLAAFPPARSAFSVLLARCVDLVAFRAALVSYRTFFNFFVAVGNPSFFGLAFKFSRDNDNDNGGGGDGRSAGSSAPEAVGW